MVFNEAAIMMGELMHRLGHNKFYIHAGGTGALVADEIATLFPKLVGKITRFFNVYETSFTTVFLGVNHFFLNEIWHGIKSQIPKDYTEQTGLLYC